MLQPDHYLKLVETTNPILNLGRVNQRIGLLIGSSGPRARLGDLCEIRQKGNRGIVVAEVVGFRDGQILLMPLSDEMGVSQGDEVLLTGNANSVLVCDEMIGRVLDAACKPIDGKGPIESQGWKRRNVFNAPPAPLERQRIKRHLATGIRSIDAFMTCGTGQRLGIFAGSGVGKSTLLGMITRNTEAEVSVIALVGERGREVRDFVERDLGESGVKKAVVIAVTSDQPAPLRVKGAFAATAIAEHFRDQGKAVMLMVDSLTRVAMAQREIGLAVGEPPTSKGYPPSVFALFPRLLERAGNTSIGSITGVYTILVEGDDFNEPISDLARSILDGHIVLSRRLATSNFFPAIDVLDSISRVMSEVVSAQHVKVAYEVREILATYREAQDLINLGAYAKGSNPRIDRAIALIERVTAFLVQRVEEGASFADTQQRLLSLLAEKANV